MLAYLRNLSKTYNVCYSRALAIDYNTITFRTNMLPGQFPLQKCLIKPLTIVTIIYPGDPFKNYLNLLLINSTTREIQRLLQN